MMRTPGTRTPYMPPVPESEFAPLIKVEALEKAMDGVSNVELGL